MTIMTQITRPFAVTLLIGALALSACTRPDRFGGVDPNAQPTGPLGTGVGTAPIGGPNDPNSPEYFSQTIGDRVLFQVDQSTLTPEGRSTLDGQAQWLLSHADYLAVIEGHADEQGTREYNVALGASRANAVRDYLISRGIPSTRLRTISYGKERPVATCADESCYSQNRRAVTIISIGATG